jgi:ATP-dependent 26S proteasome regulatory subunit
MTLQDMFRDCVAAGCSGIWLESYEHEDAAEPIVAACREYGWELGFWDVASGVMTAEQFTSPETHPGEEGSGQTIQGAGSAIAALNSLQKQVSTKGRADDARLIMVMRNLHLVIAAPDGRIVNPILLQRLQTVVEVGQRVGAIVVVLAPPGTKIPHEISKSFRVLEHKLPGRDELWKLASSLLEPEETPEETSEEAQKIVDASCGLTRMEALTAFGLSMAQNTNLVPAAIWESKKASVKKAAGISALEPGDITFDTLAGLDPLKDYLRRLYNSPRRREKHLQPSGVLWTGVPGAGKTASAKGLAAEVQVPAWQASLSLAKGMYVGQSQAQTKAMLDFFDASAPCIVLLDEIEKMLAGSTGAGQDTSGTSAEQLGLVLTWMQEHTTDVFVIATSNDIAILPPELVRRFDSVWFFDLPSPQIRTAAWNIHMARVGQLDVKTEKPDDRLWTPFEIEKCCRMAGLLEISVKEAANYIVPVAVADPNSIKKARARADRRYLSADYEGVFKMDMAPHVETDKSAEPRRRRRRVTSTAAA